MNETTELIMKQLNQKKTHAVTHEVGGGDEIDATKLKNITNYLETDGNFTGTWNGLEMTAVEEGLETAFNALKADFASTVTLTSYQYGILGDGTDETAKLTAMMIAIPANGGKLIFDKSIEVTINGTSLINISNKQNVVIEGLRAKGSSAAVFQISNGSKNITFRDCVFKDFSQVVYLFACEEIVVDNCTFDHTGYGVIQHLASVSNNVKVINCTFKNMQKDAIEANCATSAPSKNWIIANNHYLGGSGYPTASTEQRFVGITAVKNVIISNNIIENVCGDSAIHLEDILGNCTITGNIIDNVVGSAVLNSYIWIIHNEKTALIDGNIFLRSDAALTAGIVYNTSSTLTNNVKFSNNIVRGVTQNLTALRLQNHNNFSIIGNTFENLDQAITLSFSNDMLISSNEFVNNNYDINANTGVNQGACNDIQVVANKFKGSITASIEVRRNTSGTQPSNRWLVEGNTFSNDARAFDTVDMTVIGNVIASGKTLDLGGTQYVGSTGYVAESNRILGQSLRNTFSWNPGSLVDGAGETSAAVTVTGAALGDFVIVAAPYDLQGITCTAYVSAANTVIARLQNETGSTIDLAGGTWKVRVIKP